jgi:hypothetical protein
VLFFLGLLSTVGYYKFVLTTPPKFGYEMKTFYKVSDSESANEFLADSTGRLRPRVLP